MVCPPFCRRLTIVAAFCALAAPGPRSVAAGPAPAVVQGVAVTPPPAVPALATPVTGADAGAAAAPTTLGSALSSLAEVRGWGWSGPLPASEAGLTAFVQAKQQWTLAQSVARMRQRWRRQLGFDPLDARELRAFGLRPEAGTWLVQLYGAPAPLLVAGLASEADFRRHLLATLEEDEGPGELQPARTPKGLAFNRGQRRFGRSVRDAGGFARLPGACGADWVVLAAPKSEQDMAHFVDVLHAAAGAGACAGAKAPPFAPLGAAATLWLRHPPHAAQLGATTVQLMAGATGLELAARATPGAPDGLPRSDATAGEAPRPNGAPPLAQLWGARRGAALRQLADAAPQALREAELVLTQPALRELLASAARPLAAVRHPALQPLGRLLAAHEGPFWLRVDPSGPAATSAALSWAATARLDGAAAPRAVAKLVADACSARRGPAGAPASGLRCTGKSATARGQATLFCLAASGGELQLAAVDNWLLAAGNKASLARALAALPAAGAPGAGTSLGDAIELTPQLRAAVTPARAAGALELAALANVLQSALLPQGAQALAQGPLGILPQLLLAGPLGDAMRELSALGQLRVWARHDADAVVLGARLAAHDAGPP